MGPVVFGVHISTPYL